MNQAAIDYERIFKRICQSIVVDDHDCQILNSLENDISDEEFEQILRSAENEVGAESMLILRDALEMVELCGFSKESVS